MGKRSGCYTMFNAKIKHTKLDRPLYTPYHIIASQLELKIVGKLVIFTKGFGSSQVGST